jgi:hypothetical protein
MTHVSPLSILRRIAAALLVGASFTVAAAAQQPVDPNEPAQGAPLTPAPSATTPGAPARAPAPGPAARPFRDVVKDAKETTGFFNVWREGDRAWIEIRPDQFEKPFFFSIVRTRGVGERMVIAGLMGARHIAYFKKVNGHIQLIAKNTRFRARPGTPTARAVEESFSDSLLASAPIASQPSSKDQGILVEANALLLNDIPGASTLLEGAFHIPYALDGRNSSLVKAESRDTETGFDVSLHFSVSKMPAPGPDSNVRPPLDTPDPRSLFLGYRYNFAELPAPMHPRVADERVGYFTTSFTDFSDDLDPNPKVHYINRWRLEKKDPNAALSEPVKPIVYWIDRDIPEKYRKPIEEGVLEWNKAFERIGFKDAIQVKVQPDDADFETADVGHATIRWYLSSDGGPAIGPSHVDPRTGEILDADIVFTDIFARSSRRFVVEDIPHKDAAATALPSMAMPGQYCNYAQQAQDEEQFALDVLEARGEIDPASPQAEKFVDDYVRQVIAHEVGHTLGLRHNFRSSTAYTPEELANPDFTKRNGVTASVMDYAPFNIAVKGEAQGDYVNEGLGPYDYWAIEYGYKPLDGAHEKQELAKIAERGSKEPWLAYGTDEDASVGASPQGMDPTVNVWDLSSSPLEYYRKRLELSRELWARLETKQLAPGESYDSLRRSFLAGFDQLARGLVPATKYIGGIVQVRDRAGSGRLPYTPIAADQQREALKIISDGMFSVDSFKFKPQFLASLPYSRLDYYDAMAQGANVTNQPMISLPQTVLSMQRRVLDQVMSGPVAERLIESRELVADPKEAFTLSELYDGLQRAIWSELKTGREITSMRRNLQREHLRRMVGMLLHPSAQMPADARSLMRVEAQSLASEIRKAMNKPAFSKETKAHLSESLDTLEQALKAPLVRTAA